MKAVKNVACIVNTVQVYKRMTIQPWNIIFHLFSVGNTKFNVLANDRLTVCIKINQFSSH